MSKINVLVVDDSAFMRKIITDLLESDPNIVVSDTARNGLDAMNKLKTKKFDVITLDVEMPIMNGIDALKEIKKTYDTPVIMLSSTTKVGAENTVIALEEGAFDFISKPSGSISLDLHKVKEDIVKKIKEAVNKSSSFKSSRITPKLSPKPIIKRQETNNHVIKSEPIKLPSGSLKNIILIGTSTGGPKALSSLLKSLPRQKNSAILVVQHMPPGFTKSLSDRLNQQTVHDVVEASDNELVEAGKVYIAPGGLHMEVFSKGRGIYISLNKKAPVGGHRPSVNNLFESAVSIPNHNIISVVMTGMGKDGYEGLKLLKRKKTVFSIAEEESTCVVYGMPKAIIDNNLADDISPLHQIHHSIINNIKS